MATNTVATKQTHTAANNASGNTSGPYSISFDYLLESDVEVRVGNTLKTQTTHYTFPSKTSIQFTSGNFPTLGTTIEIKRNTDITIPKVDFQDGSVLTESDLDNNSKHLLFGMQETKEDTESLVSTFVGPNAPTGISNGARWYDTVSGRTFVYYVDTDSAQWVEANPPFDSEGATFLQSGTGAEVRTIASKLKDVVNVADFGATGDGTTNDTTAIQNAIDSLGDVGGVVEFNVGTFVINRTLNLKKKIHLVGKGGYFLNQFIDNAFTVGGTTIKLEANSGTDNNGTDMLKVQLDDASTGSDYRSHCSIRNIHFFGNRSNKQNPTDTTAGTVLNSSGNGIVLSGVRYVTLENVIVTKCAEDGLKLQSYAYSSGTVSTNNIDIRACAFHSNGKNGATLAGGDSIMDSCTVGYNANSGLTVTGFGIISNSLVWDNFDNGIFVQGSLENVTIVGNKIYDNDHVGIYLNDNNSFNSAIPTSNINLNTNVITKTAHGLSINDQLKYTSNGTNITKASSTAIPDGTILFVKTVPSGDTFTLSETAGGAELNLDGAGNNNQRFLKINILETATASITANKIIRNGGNSSTANLGGESSGIFINTVATNELIINGNEIGNSDDLWNTNKSYTTGNRVMNAGRLYEATGAVNLGQAAPTHLWSGTEWSNSTNYSTDTHVKASNNKIYKATTTINSGGTEPSHSSGTTNGWLFVANADWVNTDKKTVQDYGIYFNTTQTLIRGFAGNDITRNFTANIFLQPNTQPIVITSTAFEALEVQGDITSIAGNLHIKPKSGEEGIKVIPDGAIETYFNNQKRTETSNAGMILTGLTGSNPTLEIRHSNINVAGEVIRIARIDSPTVRYHSINASNSNVTDNNFIKISIHDPQDTGASPANTGRNDQIVIDDDTVSLRFDGAEKLATTSTGITVTGSVTASAGATFGGAVFDTDGNLNTTKSITITNNQPGLEFVDANDNPDFILQNRGGLFTIRDTTNNANRFFVNASSGQVQVTGGILPSADNSNALGSASQRFTTLHSAALNTGDINMSNLNDSGNEVDGSKGSWTLQEGANDLFLINRVSGKKYKFNLTEIN